MLVNGILRRDDEEFRTQFKAFRVDRDLPLGHGFQQGTLGARCRAIDFVCQQDVGEYRAAAEFEFVKFLIEDVEPGHVAGQQVRCALSTGEFSTNGRRQCFCQCCLTEAGLVF